MSAARDSPWLSYHLFYHEDRDRALHEFVQPAVGALWADRRIESFFFIRYALGGPHVRLRLRARPGQAAAVEDLLERAAAEFLLHRPSRASLPVEEILRGNRSILRHDSGEDDGEAYPDNTFRPFPLRLEIGRYGGPALSGASLDFFALSSLQALRFVVETGDTPPSRRLPRYFRLLARQALGLAAAGDELLDLLDYGVRSWPPLKPVASQGDRIFEQKPDDFQKLLRAEIALLDAPPATDLEAARRLSLELAGAEPAVRRRVATSQMHMTANRLGMTNLEEVYISRLLWRTARELAASEPALWGLTADRLSPGTPRPFGELLALAFEDLG